MRDIEFYYPQRDVSPAPQIVEVTNEVSIPIYIYAWTTINSVIAILALAHVF